MNLSRRITRPLRMLLPPVALVVAFMFSVAPGAPPRPSGLGAVVEVPVPADTGAMAPRLVAGARGGFHLTWIEPRVAGGGSLRLATWNGTGWSEPLTITSDESLFVNRADFPVVCDVGEGTLAAAWLHRTGAGHGYGVRLAFSPDLGRTWGAPVRVHDDARGMEYGFVSLVAEDAKHVRAVWLDGHNLLEGVEEGMADMTLHSRVIGADGTLGPESEVDPRTCDCCPTSAVRTRAGTLVAYRDRSAGEIRDMSVARFEGGRWSAPSPLHADLWKIEGCPVNGPALAASGTRVAAAWYTAARDLPRVWVAFSSDEGRRFGRAIRVDAGLPTGRPGIALLPDGAAVVCWLEGEKSEGRVLARRVTRDGKLGAPVTLATTPNLRATGIPQVSADGSSLLFAWTEPSRPSRLRAALIRGPELPRTGSKPSLEATGPR